MGETVDFRPRFIRKQPRRPVPARNLISLEVFSIYGWGVDDMAEITTFVRYLARSAPHLREVSLASVSAGAALALRHAISTSLIGLDLRDMVNLDDVGFATLLRSRTGRRLRSLTVPHMRMFEEEWQYGVLDRHRAQAVRAILDSSGSDDDGDTPPPPIRSSVATAVNAEGPWPLGPEPRLRRLRRVDVSILNEEQRSAAKRLFNGRRLVFTPYAIVPPL
jgi:hypothetical protein